MGRSNPMMRMGRQALERKLEHTRKVALEPTDPLTREKLAQMIEELEFQLLAPTARQSADKPPSRWTPYADT
jgi:hypothetical protein